MYLIIGIVRDNFFGILFALKPLIGLKSGIFRALELMLLI
jgi:hypothetical protein